MASTRNADRTIGNPVFYAKSTPQPKTIGATVNSNPAKRCDSPFLSMMDGSKLLGSNPAAIN